MSPLLFVGIAVVLLSNILHIVGVATTYWLKSNGKCPVHTEHHGLFKGCLRSGHCGDLNDTSTLEATRALCILGVLLAFGAAALAVIFFLIKGLQKKLVPIIWMLAAIAAFGAIILGVIVFVSDDDMYTSRCFDFGYSFVLCIIGAIGIGAGGILAFLGGRAHIS